MKPNSLVARLLNIDVPSVDATVEKLQSEIESLKATYESEKAELSTALTTAVQANVDLEAELSSLKEKLDALEAANVEAAAKAAEAKLADRRSKIEAAVGSERVDGVMAVAAELSDENFQTLMAAMSVAGAVEAKSPMFQEQGVEAKADATVATTESAEMQILRSKYKNSNA